MKPSRSVVLGTLLVVVVALGFLAIMAASKDSQNESMKRGGGKQQANKHNNNDKNKNPKNNNKDKKEDKKEQKKEEKKAEKTLPPKDTTAEKKGKGKGGKVLFGALIGPQLTGTQAPYDWNAITKWEKMAAKGKRLSALHFGGIWHNPTGCSGYCEFDQVGFDAVAAHGVFPLYSWGSDSADDSYDAQFRNAAVASGAQDEYIKRWATSAKAYGKKILLCPNWEFNGNWFNWGPQSTTAAGTNTDFVNSWRRIHNIFKEVGANNVLFGWVPNIDPDGWWAKTSGYSLESMFPGNDYVDAVGLDGYNPGDAQWQSFSQLFGSTYATLRRLAPKKPVFINEVGCTESGGSKAKWIKDMFKDLPTKFPKIKIITWYNRPDIGPNDHTDWILESSKTSLKAFAQGVSDKRYSTARK